MIKVADTREVLEELGYDIICIEEPIEKPEVTEVKFKDLVPSLEKGGERSRNIADKNLYKHQLESYKALEKGYNVILTAKTGSGKTEAWAIYALKSRKHVLAIYPTLALSSDQIKRLEDYYSSAGLRDYVVKVDRPTVEEEGANRLLERLRRALLVITNPAFLMSDVKRIAQSKRTSMLVDFLSRIDLIVLDEIDFYDPRSLGLLFALIELISSFISKKKPQIVILTATLGNPDEIAKYLEKITRRKTIILEGKPLHPENHVIIVFGKNLEELWYRAKKHIDLVDDPFIRLALENLDVFKKNAYEVIEYLKAKGVNIPKPYLDIGEILSAIALQKEEGVTLVFTRSIRLADKIYREIKSRIEPLSEDLIALHHHLIPKHERTRIEERARKGEVKLVITVRTLAQGIDIGYITRVVHIGLPEDLRVYKQREGRKGRRLDINFTETIIIPLTKWDYKLLEYGVEALSEWIQLPLEKVYINTENDYVKLFKALWKLHARIKLDKSEEELLLKLKLAKPMKTLISEYLRLTHEGKKVWSNLNFYEYGPPYGIPRILVKGLLKERIDEVSHRDLVEKFQPGTIDYLNDAIVVSIDHKTIREEPLLEALQRHNYLTEAYDDYIRIKNEWEEEPDILSDINYGKLSSIITLTVKPPYQGFGRIVIEPYSVEWQVESRNPVIVKGYRRNRVTYRREKILVTLNTYGMYEDYTYGFMYELDQQEDINMIRLGLAGLMVALRLIDHYRIPLHLIRYVVSPLKNLKYFVIWEDSVSGILNQINWSKVEEYVKALKPPKIYEALIWAIDQDAAQIITFYDLEWDDIVEAILKVTRYLRRVDIVDLREIGITRRIEIPKPSPNLGILAIALITIERGSEAYMVLALYDGNEVLKYIVKNSIIKSREQISQKLVELLGKYYTNKEWVLVHFGEELNSLAELNIVLSTFLKQLASKGKLIDVYNELKKKYNLKQITLDTLARTLGIDKNIPRYITSLTSTLKRNEEKALDILKKIAETKAKTTYTLYLALRELENERKGK